MTELVILGAAAGVSNVALISFLIYLILVIILAWLSSRAAPSGGFVSEYFLGGRNLGVCAFALTFAATSASGASAAARASSEISIPRTAPYRRSSMRRAESIVCADQSSGWR